MTPGVNFLSSLSLRMSCRDSLEARPAGRWNLSEWILGEWNLSDSILELIDNDLRKNIPIENYKIKEDITRNDAIEFINYRKCFQTKQKDKQMS